MKGGSKLTSSIFLLLPSILNNNDELDLAHAISYPLPLNILSFKSYGSIFAKFAKLLIRVDEEPNPQLLLNVNFVFTSVPFILKKSPLISLIELIIFF